VSGTLSIDPYSHLQWLIHLRYTCTDQTPTFSGCCASNPCGGDDTGCPDGDFYPSAAALSTTSSRATARSTSKTQSRSRTTLTASSPTSSQTTITTSSSSSSSTTDLAASLTSTPTPTPSSSPSTGLTHAQVRTIAGGSAGAAVFIFLLLAICLTWRRQKKSREAHVSQPPLRKAPSFPPELCEPQPTPRAPLPSLRTDLDKFQARQRTYSAYSAYSPDHITPSSFDSRHCALSTEDNLVGSQARRVSDEGYYPGRPIFGIPHALTIPEAVAQPGVGTRSPSSMGPSPPPAYFSQQHSPVSPIAGSRRSSYNYSYPSGSGVGSSNVPSAAVGPRSSERRASAQFEPRARPAMRQVRSDGAMTGYEPSRRSDPAAQPIQEYPEASGDRVPELPEYPPHLEHSRRERRRPVGTPSLRVRTTSGTARGSNQPLSASPRAESAAGGWGGDMRTDRERYRDEDLERQMRVESQSKARYSYTSTQSLSP
jgi:hypothetical protein